ncbi:hypothetical protein P3T25_004593 [Paraburkholderia sp. GAS32]
MGGQGGFESAAHPHQTYEPDTQAQHTSRLVTQVTHPRSRKLFSEASLPHEQALARPLVSHADPSATHVVRSGS